nr:immunoglobulin heavy chain junction region [Mus musculus]
CTLGHWYFDVW